MPISSEHLLAVGRITLRFGLLEFLLAPLIAGLIGDDHDIGAIVCSQLSFDRSLRVADALGHKRLDAPGHARLLDVLRQARESQELRNRLLHSVYFQDMEDDPEMLTRVKLTVKDKSGLRVTAEPVSVSDLEEAANRIGRTTASLRSLIVDLARSGHLTFALPSAT